MWIAGNEGSIFTCLVTSHGAATNLACQALRNLSFSIYMKICVGLWMAGYLCVSILNTSIEILLKQISIQSPQKSTAHALLTQVHEFFASPKFL